MHAATRMLKLRDASAALQLYRKSILHLLLCDVATVVSVKVAEGIVHSVFLLQVVQIHSGSQKLLIVNAACRTKWIIDLELSDFPVSDLQSTCASPATFCNFLVECIMQEKGPGECALHKSIHIQGKAA